MSRKQEIANLLNVSDEVAKKVLDEMNMSEVNFSECTQAEFDATARECYQYITRYEKAS